MRQRIYGLCQGYEDLNDHDTLRHNLAWQTAVERDKPLASNPTLCRLENRANRQVAWAVHQVLVDQFIASFPQAPGELILDFDAITADLEAVCAVIYESIGDSSWSSLVSNSPTFRLAVSS